MNNISEQMERFTDELINNIIINTKDSDILKEIEEDYDNSNYEVNKFKEILKEVKERICQKKKYLK